MNCKRGYEKLLIISWAIPHPKLLNHHVIIFNLFVKKKSVYCLLKATQMGCVYVTYLKLRKSSFCHIWARMNYFEACRSDGLITKSRLHSTQDGNLIKVFWWEDSKMATSVFEILDGFSLVWVPMYQQSKSAFLPVTQNFELE